MKVREINIYKEEIRLNTLRAMVTVVNCATSIGRDDVDFNIRTQHGCTLHNRLNH